jgi:hypothetical protein
MAPRFNGGIRGSAGSLNAEDEGFSPSGFRRRGVEKLARVARLPEELTWGFQLSYQTTCPGEWADRDGSAVSRADTAGSETPCESHGLGPSENPAPCPGHWVCERPSGVSSGGSHVPVLELVLGRNRAWPSENRCGRPKRTR